MQNELSELISDGLEVLAQDQQDDAAQDDAAPQHAKAVHVLIQEIGRTTDEQEPRTQMILNATLTVKSCTCCARSYTAASWNALPFVGLQYFDYGGDESESFELRNCPCKTTLAVLVATNDITTANAA